MLIGIGKDLLVSKAFVALVVHRSRVLFIISLLRLDYRNGRRRIGWDSVFIRFKLTYRTSEVSNSVSLSNSQEPGIARLKDLGNW